MTNTATTITVDEALAAVNVPELGDLADALGVDLLAASHSAAAMLLVESGWTPERAAGALTDHMADFLDRSRRPAYQAVKEELCSRVYAEARAAAGVAA